ncbi:MAG TPA: hypothetical protein VGV16_07870 [Gammaproteobacteria bacterium]|nr:hypothetical protein [Gammaproteobacteria bacterium]
MKKCACLLALLLCGCIHAPLNDIPLVWKPTSSIGDFGALDVSGFMDVKMQVDKFTDTRKDPQLIAENRENAQPRPVTTRDDVGAFVADNMRDTMRKSGLDVVDSGGQVVISGEVVDFFVNETNTYESTVTLRVTARDAAGKTLWSGVTGGSATRFGRSYKAENYYEVLSDSVLEATYNLMSSPKFEAALTHKG